MSIYYVIAGGIGLLGYFIESDVFFKIGAFSCFVLLTISFLIRGVTIDKIRAGAFPNREGYIVKLGLFSRTLSACVMYIPLYYFFPTIMSWIIIIYCLSSILNILSSIFNKALNNQNYDSK